MTIEITYYGSTQNPNIYGQPIASEKVTASAVSAQSTSTTPTNCTIVRIAATANDRYAYGSNPTAVATATGGADCHYIGSGAVIDLEAKPGYKIAVITAS